MKKVIAGILIGAMTASMLTACAGKTTPSGSGEVTQEVTTVAEANTQAVTEKMTEEATTQEETTAKAEYPMEVSYAESLKDAFPKDNFAMYCATDEEGVNMLVTMAKCGANDMISIYAAMEGNAASFALYTVDGQMYGMSTAVQGSDMQQQYYKVTGDGTGDVSEGLVEDPEDSLSEDQIEKIMLTGTEVFEAYDGSIDCNVYEVTTKDGEVYNCLVGAKSGLLVSMKMETEGTVADITVQQLDKIELPEEFKTEPLEEMTSEDAMMSLFMPIMAVAFGSVDEEDMTFDLSDLGDFSMSYVPETAVLDEGTGLYVSEETDGIYVYLVGADGYGYQMYDEKKESCGSMSMNLTDEEEKFLEENADKALKSVLK